MIIGTSNIIHIHDKDIERLLVSLDQICQKVDRRQADVIFLRELLQNRSLQALVLAGKREYHNLMERKRRNNIIDCFCQFRDVLPCFNKERKVRASKAQILEKSCDFIRKQPDLQKLKEETRSLDEENKFLLKSIEELEEAIENDDLETIARFMYTDISLKPRCYMLESDDTDSEDHVSSVEDGNPFLAPYPVPACKRVKRS